MANQKKELRLWVLVGAFLLVLQACGGGSPSGDSSAVPPTPDSSPPAGTTAYSIGGSVIGVVGPGLVLQLNGGADIGVDISRAFKFDATVKVGAAYQVTIKSNPAGQICMVTANGAGMGTADITDVAVTCTTPVPVGPNSLKIGGTINGLIGSGLTLNNGLEEIPVAPGSTNFVFPTGLATSTPYEVTIVGSPATQTCILSNGVGTVASCDVTTIVVTCVTPTPAPSIGLMLDQSSLTFVGEEGQQVAAQVLSGSITGATEPVFVTISYTNNGLFYANFSRLTNTSGQLVVTPKEPVALAAGTYKDTITVTACFDQACTRPVAGSPKTVNVSYTVKPPRPAPALLASDRGVAFATVAGASQLTRTLTVRDTSSSMSSWTAAVSQPWLRATASGSSGDSLVLTANVSGLTEGFHLATVTLTSSNPAITKAETVRVGLYVSSSASALALTDPLPTPVERYPSIADTRQAVDPIRPLIYSAANSTIAAHHIHTGVRVATLNIDGADLGGVVVNDDGSRLFALNYANATVVVVDLDLMTVVENYGFPQLLMFGYSLRDSRIAYARVHGQSALLMSYAKMAWGASERSFAPVFKADTGELVGEVDGISRFVFSKWEYTRFSVSRDGRTVYAADAGLSGMLSITRVELRANSLGNIYGKSVAMTTRVGVAALLDIATNSDGSRVLVGYATDRSVREAVYNGKDLEWTPGLPDFVWPLNVLKNGMNPADIEFDAYGKLFVHDYDYDLRVYNPQGLLAKEWVLPEDGAVARGPSGAMRISSDGLRVIGNGALMTIQP